MDLKLLQQEALEPECKYAAFLQASLLVSQQHGVTPQFINPIQLEAVLCLQGLPTSVGTTALIGEPCKHCRLCVLPFADPSLMHTNFQHCFTVAGCSQPSISAQQSDKQLGGAHGDPHTA